MKVAIYARVSTSHHNQNPDIQLQELRRFCSNRDYLILHEIVDHGFSGSSTTRPGLIKLFDLIRTNQIDGVIVVKLDRLFRSLKHLVISLEEMVRLKITFIAINDHVDYTTPSGRLFVQVLGSLGEFERALLRERTMAGLDYAKRMGKKFGRPRKHDHEAILSLYNKGYTYRAIKNELKVPMGTICRVVNVARKSVQSNP